MIFTSTSFTGNLRNLNDLYKSFGDAETLSAIFANSSLSSEVFAIPLVNYNNFKEHIFFDKALRKLEAAFNKILNEYPIGISGTAVNNLDGVDVGAVNIFLNNATEFEKYALNYIGGATSEVSNQKPTITAAATVNGIVNPLIVVYRNANNTISGNQATLTSNLYNIAFDFDNNLNTVQKYSLTADHDITFVDDGVEIQDRILPSIITERVSRISDLSELIPDAYFYDDVENNLEKYLAVIGRTFDETKLYIDELVNLNTISYGKYHRVPNGLFQTTLAKQYGIDVISSALNEKINSYLRSVNNKLPVRKVESVIFNRILNNLVALLKRKGTKEALQSIIRVFGLPTDYMNLNSYEYFGEEQLKSRVDYPNTRVLNNTNTLGKITFDPSYSGSFAFTGDFTLEARICLTGSYLQPNSGIIFWYGNSISGYHLAYKDGRFFFRVNNTTISTTSTSATFFANTLSSSFVNVFGIRNSGTASIKTSWVDTTVGTGTYIVRSSSGYSVDPITLTGTAGALSAFICGSTAGTSGFVGYVNEVKGFNVPLSDVDIEEHTRNFESISIANTIGGNSSSLKFHYKLKENKTITDPNNYVIDSSGNSTTGYFSSVFNNKNPYHLIELMRKETTYSSFGGFVDDNIEFTINDQTTNSKVKNKGVIVLSFSPMEAVNNDIENVLGNFNLGNLIADPRNFLVSASSYKTYPAMVATANTVFRRYAGNRLNFNAYLKAIDKFSPVVQGIIQIADQFVPARTKFISKGVLLEPHILDRPRNRQLTIQSTNEDNGTTADLYALNQVYEDCDLDFSIRMLDNALTSLVDMSSSIQLDSDDNFNGTEEYLNLSGDRVIYVSNTAFGCTLNTVYKVSENNFILPYMQEVANVNDTAILFTTNKNIIENASSLSSYENRITITGNAKLIRSSSGRVITSQFKSLRLEFPTLANNRYASLSVTADDTKINTTFAEFINNSKNGINFKFESAYKDIFLGIQNLRIINLLSGNSQEFPIIVMPTSANANAIAGGQLVIKIGKAIV